MTSERLRIAQELHDVVAHAMSVIAVQSGMGAHVIDTQPDEAKKALQAIESQSRGALEEMRRMLGVLREQRILHRGRLFLKYVETGTRDFAAGHRFVQCGTVYQFTACHVDDADTSFHFGESGGG